VRRPWQSLRCEAREGHALGRCHPWAGDQAVLRRPHPAIARATIQPGTGLSRWRDWCTNIHTHAGAHTHTHTHTHTTHTHTRTSWSADGVVAAVVAELELEGGPAKGLRAAGGGSGERDGPSAGQWQAQALHLVAQCPCNLALLLPSGKHRRCIWPPSVHATER